jgi:fructokinase
VGHDDPGREIKAFMTSMEMPLIGVAEDEELPTGEVRVALDEKGVPTYDIIKDRAWDRLCFNSHADKLLEEEVSLICFGTLAQRSSRSRETIRTLVERAGPGVFKVCDINLRQDFYDRTLIEWCFEKSHMVKLNEDELNEIGRIFGESNGFARRLVERYGLRCLCVTRGAEGSELFLSEGDKISQPAGRAAGDETVDTVGAGDAFTAMLCAGYLRGLDWKTSMDLASRFAARICSIRGALPDDSSFYVSFKEKLEGSYHEC